MRIPFALSRFRGKAPFRLTLLVCNGIMACHALVAGLGIADMSKTMYVLGALVVAGFAVLGVLEMVQTRAPYVTTVAKVRSMGDRPIRFAGTIVPGETHYDTSTDELRFVLKDRRGSRLRVRYKGVAPEGFASARKVAIRGTWLGSEFVADEVRVEE